MDTATITLIVSSLTAVAAQARAEAKVDRLRERVELLRGKLAEERAAREQRDA